MPEQALLPKAFAAVFSAFMLFILLAFGRTAVFAAGPYAQALSDFQSRKYSQALAGFKSASAQNPSDPNCHYYMALCYQYLNQASLAANEYQWVASYSRDPRLKAQAQTGLAQMGRYQSARASQTAASAASAALNSSSLTSSGSPASPFSRGRLKVIEFNTKWCHVCKTFDPIFSSVQSNSKFSSTCSFQQLDAEDPQNVDLANKYEIKAYPTVIFADSNGRVVNRFAGGTNAEGLISLIDQSLQKLPH
ncbi:MAG: thioredoxin family protein [Candidatus Obscuribacterales bacterium]|nr:thioredoxin family protein [Candidatus Obscuribacterales bacterium]